MKQDLTVFALSSGSGRAGVAVIRVSGPEAAATFRTFGVSCPAPRLAAVRRLKDANGEPLDEALVLWLPGPGTATGEDMAELHLHGSPSVIAAALGRLSRTERFALAQPGDFTRRAFRNGKLDLLQVEGLADVLESRSEGQRRLAMRQFLGTASTVYETWRDSLVRALSLVEAAIDFSEEDDVSARAASESQTAMMQLIAAFEQALLQAERAAEVRQGLRIVLAGPPNAGKSSLLNWLVERDAAIVSPVAGTTRDVVESGLEIEGMSVLVSDTAGLREGSLDPIEQEGMRRTRAAVGNADIVVWIEAFGEGPGPALPRAPDFHVVNKIDLVADRGVDWQGEKVWPVSVRSGEGLSRFRSALENLIRERNQLGENAVVVRERHRVALENALSHLRAAMLEDGRGLEFVAEDMRKAAAELAGVTGRVDVEDLLGAIFSSFCIGK
jgi:tRNA modification GTPase